MAIFPAYKVDHLINVTGIAMKLTIKSFKQLSVLLLLLSAFTLTSYATDNQLKSIDVHSDKIRYLGTSYVYKTNSENKQQVSFTRHAKSVLALPKKDTNFNSDKAQTNASIAINFATASNNVVLTFKALPKINRGSDIAVYQVTTQGEQLIKTVKASPKKASFKVTFQSKKSNQLSEYKVLLPSLANLALISLEIDNYSELTTIATPRKAKYIVMGDSISHGVGQGSASYLTYPYQVAQALGLELFNLAVGGAQISIPTAQMLTDFKNVKLISLLIGYNDWNAANADLATFKEKYSNVIDTTLNLHPEADLYCITPLFTRLDKAKHSKLPIQAYRDVIIDLVKEKQQSGNTKLHIVHGDTISSVNNLRNDKLADPVHLGVKGAKLFADELINIFND